MTKKKLIKLVSEIKERFPDEFNKLSKEEQQKYIQTFDKLFIRFDYDLVEKAMYRIYEKKYPKAPTFIQMKLSVSRVLFERRSEVFIKMWENGFYRKYITDVSDISKAEFDMCDAISIEFLQDQISNFHKYQIINAVNECDYLKEYRGLKLFDDDLPIPPGV